MLNLYLGWKRNRVLKFSSHIKINILYYYWTLVKNRTYKLIIIFKIMIHIMFIMIREELLKKLNLINKTRKIMLCIKEILVKIN